MCMKLPRQKGVSLVEVLVSIVIASIGLLAMAGINAAAVRYTKLTQYRATASQLSADLGERMRANFQGVKDGSYTYQESFANQVAATPVLPTKQCNGTAATDKCTPADMAALDLAQWRLVVRAALPKGSVVVTPETADVAVDTWVVWEDPAVQNNDEISSSGSAECPTVVARGSNKAIRCSYVRINL